MTDTVSKATVGYERIQEVLRLKAACRTSRAHAEPLSSRVKSNFSS
jgi:hypothetical protein